jgi:hypothetical protein
VHLLSSLACSCLLSTLSRSLNFICLTCPLFLSLLSLSYSLEGRDRVQHRQPQSRHCVHCPRPSVKRNFKGKRLRQLQQGPPTTALSIKNYQPYRNCSETLTL